MQHFITSERLILIANNFFDVVCEIIMTKCVFYKCFAGMLEIIHSGFLMGVAAGLQEWACQGFCLRIIQKKS